MTKNEKNVINFTNLNNLTKLWYFVENWNMIKMWRIWELKKKLKKWQKFCENAKYFNYLAELFRKNEFSTKIKFKKYVAE